MGAHLNQTCNNFKDPGVQDYMGKVFKQVRDSVDAVFMKLPPPRPSGAAYGRAAARPVDIISYNNSSGPCFAGASRVKLADGSHVRVDQLKKTQLVSTPYGVAAVECVVETRCGAPVTLCELPGSTGLLVTPWHPVRLPGASEWTFPAFLIEPKLHSDCGAIYSVVLDRHHVLEIEGVEAVGLGHAFQDKVAEHPYFGRNAVRDDLARMRGWNEGRVVLQAPGCIERDPASGIVCRLVQHAETA